MIFTNTQNLERIKKFTESKYLDFIGLVVVLGGSLALGFHKTILPLNVFGYRIENYTLGIQSVLGVTL